LPEAENMLRTEDDIINPDASLFDEKTQEGKYRKRRLSLVVEEKNQIHTP